MHGIVVREDERSTFERGLAVRQESTGRVVYYSSCGGLHRLLLRLWLRATPARAPQRCDPIRSTSGSSQSRPASAADCSPHPPSLSLPPIQLWATVRTSPSSHREMQKGEDGANPALTLRRTTWIAAKWSVQNMDGNWEWPVWNLLRSVFRKRKLLRSSMCTVYLRVGRWPVWYIAVVYMIPNHAYRTH
jgi:hypothetical protein